MNTTTTAIEPHNVKAATVWSSGGAEYDAISHGISDALAHCVLRLHPLRGERVLDLATGTGWTSRLVARRGATVIGADIASDLLDAARARAKAENLAIEYQIADAENLPFDDGRFDAISSTFGVMFATRPEAAARELARVSRTGGRVALTTWTPDGNIFKMFQVMKRYMPAPPVPAPPSPFEWGNPDRIRELLGPSFNLKFERGVSYYREPTAEAAWETFSTGYGPTRSLAMSLDPDRREGLRAEFVAFHSGFATPLGICVPREYWVTVGIRK
jgi:SAM-dependent methyltransferase